MKKISDKKEVYPGWRISVSEKHIIGEVILSFYITYILFINILFAFTSTMVGSYYSITLFSAFTIFFILEVVVIAVIFLKFLYKPYLNNIKDWSKFFDCYHGKIANNINSKESLIKVHAKCLAISFNKKYQGKIEDFSQHFLIDIKRIKKPLNVIRIKEANPFLNTKNIVKEGEKLLLIGEIRFAVDDETFYHNYDKVTKLFFAYHVQALDNKV